MADHDFKALMAQLSWRLPLIGLVLSLVLMWIGEPIAMIAGVVFSGGIVLGFILVIIALVSSMTCWRVARTAILGLLLNSLLSLPIYMAYTVVSQSHDAAMKDQDKAELINRVDGSTASVPGKVNTN